MDKLNFRKISEIPQHFPTPDQFWIFTMIQIHAWQVNFQRDKLDLGLLVRMDKLKGILKLYTEYLWYKLDTYPVSHD